MFKKTFGIDDVFIEEYSLDGEVLWRHVDKAMQQNRRIWIRSSLLESLNSSLGHVYDSKRWLVIKTMPKLPLDWLLRARDIVVSFSALAILSPFLFVLAFLVKISSFGPIFYKASVVGQEGRLFVWRKFRSMAVVPEQEDEKGREERFRQYVEGRNVGPTLYASAKVIDDCRLTSIGGFIRKYSLDELPQLWNVLVGQMSLVGPRPCLPYEAKFFTGWRQHRFDIRPGLTGVWQVFGRGRVGFDEGIAMDIYYLYRRSFWFDLYLLIKTVGVVITGKGGR